MFTEITFKVLIPRGFDYWIDGIVKILNAFGTHMRKNNQISEDCSNL